MKRIVLSLFALSVLSAAAPAFAGKQAGPVIIRDEGAGWGSYVKPEITTMRADVVKFQLSYDNNWPSGQPYPTYFTVPAAQLNDAIAGGARDLILRSQETKIGVNEINHFIQGMRFRDTGERLVDYIYNHRLQVHCWIEVGNEPDLHGADPYVHRYYLIQVANQIMPNWTWLWTMHWIASAPARVGSYSDVFYWTNSEGSVQTKYEAIGPHEYADFDFNYAVINRALQAINGLSGKLIWVTEAGINHNYDWGTKGVKYRDAVRRYAADARVRGWTFFTTTLDRYWNTCPNGDGTCFRYGIDLNYNTTTTTAGRPCATQIAGR